MRLRWRRLLSVRGVRAFFAPAVVAAALFSAVPVLHINAQYAASPPAGASCAQLAAVDHTATNSAEWGRTLLSGHNAKGGWFGVDVCGNGVNSVAPGGANLSCDRVPADLAKTGCAPGHATYDGYGLTFQCVELVARFSAWAFGDKPSAWIGNAPDLWTHGNHPSDFVAYPNGSTSKPVPGDVLVWGTVDAHGKPWPAGPAGGHTAVVASVTAAHLVFVEENALSGQLNVPRETTTLAHTEGRWIVGGGLATQPGKRALYGWLHSKKNTGHFTGSGAVRGLAPRTPAVSSPTPAGADPTIVLPSLTPAVIVTAAGTLADLVWPDGTSSAFTLSAASSSPSPPHAAARSLGAPRGAALAPDQVPAVVLFPDGSRDVYLRGQDGMVYDAHTTPTRLGVTWRPLSAPPGATLTGSIAATALPSGAAIAAVSADGTLWWRAGPAGNPGDWTAIGHPAMTPLQASVVLAGQPGSGQPLAMAIGRDGRLYETQWVDASTDHPEWQPGWDGWTEIKLPVGAATPTAPLRPIFELPAGQGWIGQWADVSLDVALRDSLGALWLLHLGPDQQWRVHSISASQPITSILAGVAVQPPTTGAQLGVTRLHLYVAGDAAVELGSFSLDASGAVSTPQWTAISPPSSAASALTIGTAISLGPDLSALVASTGRAVELLGTRDALALVAAQGTGAASAATSATSATADTASTSPIQAGTLPASTSFSDAFVLPTLDSRWLPLDVPSAARIASGTLSLPPAVSPDRAELLQTAPGGDFALTARVALPAGQRSDVRAGLILYLDDADWLTLAVDPTGVATLCPVAWNEPAACLASTPIAGATTSRGVLLKLTRTGDTFTGQVSTNGAHWVTAGQWTPALPPRLAAQAPSAVSVPPATNRGATSQQPAGSQTSVTATMPFTCAGLFAQQAIGSATASTARAQPLFFYFDISPLAPTPSQP
jgi:regulation of enolase protein 1 (concanavalin A-like superfamily)